MKLAFISILTAATFMHLPAFAFQNCKDQIIEAAVFEADSALAGTNKACSPRTEELRPIDFKTIEVTLSCHDLNNAEEDSFAKKIIVKISGKNSCQVLSSIPAEESHSSGQLELQQGLAPEL